MKKKSLIAALTLSTILCACSGGGGGSGHIPTTTLPNIPDTPSVACEGVTCMTNDGLSNDTKRQELFVKAGGVITKRMTRSASDPIEQAYNDMKVSLIDNLDTSDANKLRKFLTLAGFEDLPTDDGKLQAWAGERQHMIKKHAQKAHDMYAKPDKVFIDNVRLHLVEETAIQDTYINFTIDDKKNINGIEIAENDFGAEAVTNKLSSVNGNNFSGTAENNTLHKYVFDYQGRKLMIEVSGYAKDETPDLAFIKEKLELKLQERAKEDSDAGDDYLESNQNAISQAIKALVDTNDLNHNVIERTFEATYASAAKNLGGKEGNNLLYSDFGTLSLTGTRTNITDPETENFEKTQVFAGGYDALKINPEKITGNMHFEGDAVGGVNYKQIVSGDETIKDSATMKLEGGKAVLDFANGQEKLNATFSNWYDVEVSKNLSTGQGDIAFSNGDKIVDDKFKFDNKENYQVDNFIGETWDKVTNNMAAGAMDMGYYGKDGKPSESTGYVMYHEEVQNKVDTDLLDVLEVQIGVGMQKK